MLKKFISGLLFGAGFAVAFLLIWAMAPMMLLKFDHPGEAITHEPAIDHWKSAQAVEEKGIEIPRGGGVLMMSPLSSPPGSKRPNTFQIWLTESGFWEIRTSDEKVETAKLPYPTRITASRLSDFMLQKTGPVANQSTLTFSSDEIRKIAQDGNSPTDASIGDRVMITTDGIVFIEPSPNR